MLSDEEKEAIDNMKSLLLYSKEHEYFSPFQEQEIDDMNIVLTIVEKHSKEIEELKNADLTTVYLNGVYDGEKKVKDKIKAKIEELDYNDIANFERRCKQEVLQSLLEKE